MLGVDPETVIEDADPPIAVRLGQADIDPPGGAGPEANGVVQQLADGEAQPVAVPLDRCRASVTGKLDGEVAEASLLVFDHRLEQTDQIDWLRRHHPS